MNVKQSDGSSEFDHLESAARQGDRLAQQKLDGLLCCPEPVTYLWFYFLELHNCRRNYGWGATPVTYSEIYSWSQLRGIKLDAWELDTLLKLDDAFLTVYAKTQKKNEGSNGG